LINALYLCVQSDGILSKLVCHISPHIRCVKYDYGKTLTQLALEQITHGPSHHVCCCVKPDRGIMLKTLSHTSSQRKENKTVSINDRRRVVFVGGRRRADVLVRGVQTAIRVCEVEGRIRHGHNVLVDRIRRHVRRGRLMRVGGEIGQSGRAHGKAAQVGRIGQGQQRTQQRVATAASSAVNALIGALERRRHRSGHPRPRLERQHRRRGHGPCHAGQVSQHTVLQLLLPSELCSSVLEPHLQTIDRCMQRWAG
jgi:hypothetical protein